MIKRAMVLLGWFLIAGCKTAPVTEPKTDPLVEPTIGEVKVDKPMTETKTFTTPHGSIEDLYFGFETTEGDRCVVGIDMGSFSITTSNHVWSGHPCPYPKGDNAFPLDQIAVDAIQEVLSSMEYQVEIDEERDESDIYDEMMFQVNGELYIIPMLLREVIETHAQRLAGETVK